MAEAAGRRAREYGCGGALKRYAWWTADGVDAGVDAVKPPGADAMRDCIVSQPNAAKLRACDVAVLPERDLSDGGVLGYFSTHT